MEGSHRDASICSTARQLDNIVLVTRFSESEHIQPRYVSPWETTNLALLSCLSLPIIYEDSQSHILFVMLRYLNKY
jgi:hypothetical protein